MLYAMQFFVDFRLGCRPGSKDCHRQAHAVGNPEQIGSNRPQSATIHLAPTVLTGTYVIGRLGQLPWQ